MHLEYWKAVYAKINSGQRVFVAIVAQNTDHSPGTMGARMFVSQEGDIFGTIGGGNMELQVTRKALQELAGKQFQMQVQTLHHKKSGPGEKSGMICAGSQTNVYYLCSESDRPEVEKIIEFINEDVPAILSVSNQGMTVTASNFDTQHPQINLCQNNAWIYEEQLLNRKRIAIIGGGHCSLALSKVMHDLGYVVSVFDTRDKVFTFCNNHWARYKQTVIDYKEAGERINYPEITYVVVMTTDFPSDIKGLLGTVLYPFPFIGVMGSKAKIAKIFQSLREEGITEETLSNLYAPVGLPINSHTPEEIAISIAAQILQERKYV